ncbi:MAG: hypothetical protein V1778_03715, partial [bacterium]
PQTQGLTLTAYDQCLSTKPHLQESLDHYNAGLNNGVIGTPTWFINGYRIPGVITQSDLQQIIDLGLAGKLN